LYIFKYQQSILCKVGGNAVYFECKQTNGDSSAEFLVIKVNLCAVLLW